MSTWTTLEIPILEAPQHECNGLITGLFYQRTISAVVGDGEKDPFLVRRIDIKIYVCFACDKQFGVRET